jgi:hypothetical protein
MILVLCIMLCIVFLRLVSYPAVGFVKEFMCAHARACTGVCTYVVHFEMISLLCFS